MPLRLLLGENDPPPERLSLGRGWAVRAEAGDRPGISVALSDGAIRAAPIDQPGPLSRDMVRRAFWRHQRAIASAAEAVLDGMPHRLVTGVLLDPGLEDGRVLYGVRAK